MVFESSSFTVSGPSTYSLNGTLTLRGVSLPVTLQAELGGIVQDGYGQTKAGFTVSGKINRKEFGLNWNAITEAGGVTVSEEVQLIADIQLIKQA
jgi:polyisoprenoid-binding protein YceI